MEDENGSGMRERERERRGEGTDEAFIKLALSQHRTIIAE